MTSKFSPDDIKAIAEKVHTIRAPDELFLRDLASILYQGETVENKGSSELAQDIYTHLQRIGLVRPQDIFKLKYYRGKKK